MEYFSFFIKDNYLVKNQSNESIIIYAAASMYMYAN